MSLIQGASGKGLGGEVFTTVSGPITGDKWEWEMVLPVPAYKVNYLACENLWVARSPAILISSQIFLDNIWAEMKKDISSNILVGQYIVGDTRAASELRYQMSTDIPATLALTDLPGYDPSWSFSHVPSRDPVYLETLRKIGHAAAKKFISYIISVQNGGKLITDPTARFNHPYLKVFGNNFMALREFEGTPPPPSHITFRILGSTQDGPSIAGAITSIIPFNLMVGEGDPHVFSDDVYGLIIPPVNMMNVEDIYHYEGNHEIGEYSLDEPTQTQMNIVLENTAPPGPPPVKPHEMQEWLLPFFGVGWHKERTVEITIKYLAVNPDIDEISEISIIAADEGHYKCVEDYERSHEQRALGPFKSGAFAPTLGARTITSSGSPKNYILSGAVTESIPIDHPSRVCRFRSNFQSMDKQELIFWATQGDSARKMIKRSSNRVTPYQVTRADEDPLNNIIALYCNIVTVQQIDNQLEPLLAMGPLENVSGFSPQTFQTLVLHRRIPQQMEWKRTTCSGTTTRVRFWIEDLSARTPNFYAQSDTCIAIVQLRFTEDPSLL